MLCGDGPARRLGPFLSVRQTSGPFPRPVSQPGSSHPTVAQRSCKAAPAALAQGIGRSRIEAESPVESFTSRKIISQPMPWFQARENFPGAGQIIRRKTWLQDKTTTSRPAAGLQKEGQRNPKSPVGTESYTFSRFVARECPQAHHNNLRGEEISGIIQCVRWVFWKGFRKDLKIEGSKT